VSLSAKLSIVLEKLKSSVKSRDSYGAVAYCKLSTPRRSVTIELSVCLSVCLSVRHTLELYRRQQRNIRIIPPMDSQQTLVFLQYQIHREIRNGSPRARA